MTSYDSTGTYGHPDHLKVHEVGAAVAETTGIKTYEHAINRDAFFRLADALQATGIAPPLETSENSWGVSEAEMTTVLHVRPWLEQKRAAMAAHASQVLEGSFSSVFRTTSLRTCSDSSTTYCAARRPG